MYAKVFVEELNKKFAGEVEYTVVPGKVYDKIVSRTLRGTQRSVHAFVVKETGDLVKAASWKAPQKSITHPSGLAIRYNISTPESVDSVVELADMFGGYLYAN
jgi:isocitrate dehydrogenase kinase/phosphatase